MLNILNFLKTQVLFDKPSKYNGEVKVIKILNTVKLRTDGVTQSANYKSQFAKDGYWKKAAKILITKTNNPKDILLLGLGGGTVINYIAEQMPNCNQVCVEIDEVVIEACNRYFDLSSIKSLKIINADAFDFIANPIKYNGTKNFDAIFADTFRGGFFVKIPDLQLYLGQLKSLLNPKGLVLFNYTFHKGDQTSVDTFINEIKHVFGNCEFEIVHGAATTDNYLIFAHA
jgi:spermidine synthase